MTADLTDWHRQVADEHREDQRDDETPTRDDWFWDEYGDAEREWRQ